MLTLFTLALMAAAVWFWADSLRAREATLEACRRACEQMRLQLLDQTVALSRMALDRNARGHLLLRRYYSFEFSTNGADRHGGIVSLLGQQVEFVRLEHPSGPIIVTGGHLHALN